MAATVPFGTTHLAKSIDPSDSIPSKEHPSVIALFNVVTEDYFQTLGIPLLRGRPFVPAESTPKSKSHVAILDKVAAEKLWPGRNALGKQIRLEGNRTGGKAEICEVVGIVGNVRESILRGEIQPHVYIPFGQQYQGDMQIHLKVAGAGPVAEGRMLETIRHEIRVTDERLPLLALKTMRGNLESSLDVWVVRTGARVLETLGGVALFLAVVGLYAIYAYTVARRTREIGIRMAIGADASSMLRMVLREGLRVTAVGVGIGLLLAIGLGKMLGGFLYGIRGTDPLVLLAAPVILASVALLACYLPARKASRVDPMIALRYE
jgi:putative ABC transport system permease protein